jgi:GNAT superfamily N-acetyltransferase
MHFTTVTHPNQVQKILDLQAENHAATLQTEESRRDGFVTVRHDPVVLADMNVAMPSVIALADENALAGYCLAMPRSFAPRIPILRPMFERLSLLSWGGVDLATHDRWFVMGQVCVGDRFRGQGVFDGMYAHLREVYRDQHDFVVTEVVDTNPRSLRAHERVGFQTLRTYTNEHTGALWHIIVWDF